MKTGMKRLSSLLLAMVLCFSLVIPCFMAAEAASSLSGYWQDGVKIKDGNRSYTVGAYVLYTPLKNVTSIDISIDVTMYYNTHCSNWNVWGRNGNSYTKIGSIYLPGGEGYTYKTVYFSSPKNFDAIALTPGVSGNISWYMEVGLYNPVTKTTSSGSSSYSGGSSTYSSSRNGILSGKWQSVTILNGNIRSNVYGYILNTPVKKCTQMTIDMSVNMYYNTSCEKWQVWGRSNGQYVKLGTINLPGGNGSTTATLRFSSGKSFDAIAITPVKSGGFSYSLDFNVYNVYTA